MPSEVWGETVVEPYERGTKQEIAAADTTIVGKLKARAALEDGEDGGWLDNVREVRVQDFVVEESQNQCECGI